MTRIPTSQDWIDNPDGALAAALEIAEITATHGDVATAGIALGIASRIMRAAAPVIGASIGGIPEMVEDGVNGYLFTSGSYSELQSALEKIISLPDSRIADLGAAGREKAERSFSPARHYQMLFNIYEELVRGK